MMILRKPKTKPYSMKKTKSTNKKIIIVALLVVAALLVAGFLYTSQRAEDKTGSITEAGTISSGEGPKIDLSPPTAQDIQDTDARKESLANQNQTPTAGADGKVQVSPVITSATSTEVRAFVSGVFEDNGTCTATFKQGGTSFTKQSAGFGNVNSTNCTPITLTRSDFSSAGQWTVIVTYSSTKAAGSSSSSTFTVQ